MSDSDTDDSLIVQLHHAATPVGGGSTQIIQGVEKIDRSLSFRNVFDSLDMCAPYEIVAIDLLGGVHASANSYSVRDFEKKAGKTISSIERLSNFEIIDW